MAATALASFNVTASTAIPGGRNWKDPELQTAIRKKITIALPG